MDIASVIMFSGYGPTPRANGSGASLSESGQIDWLRANLNAIQKSTVRNLQTFAPVHELKEFLLENYSEIRKYRVVPVLYETEQSANAVILYQNTSQKALGFHLLSL